MKKRVLSMFMALALCLTLLPAPAWAAEADAPESGAAQVTTAEGAERVYGSFNEAWSAAIKSKGSTLKLLSDVELPEEVGEDGLPVSEGSFTLDLNNKTLKGAIWNQLLEVSGTANITIKNGSLVNTQPGYAGSATSTNLVALKISGGTVALDNVNLTSGINSEGERTSALYITGGSLTVTGSTFTGEVTVRCENSDTRPALSIADATLNNGILYGVAGIQASDTAGLEAIFADGSMLFDQNSKYIDLASKEYWYLEEDGASFFYTKKCIVKPHTHEVVNGACKCGATFAASVTQNGTVTYYKDFHTALDAANAGDTLTLLADVQGDVTVTIDKAITFDLNGHRIYDLTVECKIILKDSAGGTGKIAEWLRVENGLHIGDLLEEGYALRNAGTGAWYGETEQTVGNVTVQQAPITSVTLTALNADGTDASTSIPYGTTGGIKLSASCTRQGAGELSCQWYTIGGTLQLIDGATKPVYQLPADLSVGEYTYRVTFTADGYSKSADITITVTATNKIVPTGEPTLSATTLTYGQALSAIKLSGKLHDNVNNKDVEGTFTWADGTVKPSAGSYEAAWKFTPTDGDTYTETIGTVSITVNKAKPTGDPIYTKITAANKTLKDAALKPNTSWPTGTIQWVDKDGKELPDTTEVKANTAYKWIFTPTGADADNYTTAEGTVILYSVSTGGGGGGSVTTYAVNVEDTDNGTVTASVKSASKGSTVTLTVKPDEGYQLDQLTVTDKDGKEISVTEKEDGKYTFTMPASEVSVSAAFTKSEEKPEQIAGFTDVLTTDWFADAVQYAVDNGMMNGTSETTFHPNGTTTRGMIVTILYRLEKEPAVDNGAGFADVAADQYYADAVAWASANDIVTGYSEEKFGPDDSITREQFAAILYRYAQYKKIDVTATADLSGYADAAQISAYAETAMKWANGEGLITGVTDTMLKPAGNATRAQAATILMRFCEEVAK